MSDGERRAEGCNNKNEQDIVLIELNWDLLSPKYRQWFLAKLKAVFSNKTC